MQIMGQTARENGFDGECLLELVDPAKNIELGTKILSKFLHLTNGDKERALLKWNGGADAHYPIEVLAHIETGEIDRILTR
jgi:soluble lytic murein transglycosylase-like protein